LILNREEFNAIPLSKEQNVINYLDSLIVIKKLFKTSLEFEYKCPIALNSVFLSSYEPKILYFQCLTNGSKTNGNELKYNDQSITYEIHQPRNGIYKMFLISNGEIDLKDIKLLK
jgi:hypothetical protein